MIGRKTKTTDTAALAQIMQGDVLALGTLYDRYGALLYRLALRITNDRSTAEEVVQLVFQGIWKSPTRLPSSESIAHALIVLTRQRALAMVHPSYTTLAVGADAQGASYAPRAEDCSDIKMDTSAVRAALLALPAHQCEIIESAYYGGQTCAAIAAQVGRPLAAVKADLRQGLLALHAHLHVCAKDVE